MHTTLSSMRRPIFDREQIKLAAIVMMTLNHIAAIFLNDGSLLNSFLAGIGYFTAPVMCYFLVEGFRYTRSRKNYGLRLLLFSLLSQLPFSLAFHDLIKTFSVPVYLNVIFTFLTCFLILCAMEYMLPGPVQALLIFFLICLTSLMDWGIMAPFMVIFFRQAEQTPDRLFAGFAVPLIMLPFSHLMRADGTIPGALCTMTGPLAAAICILFFYNGTEHGRIIRSDRQSAHSAHAPAVSHTKKEKTSAFSKWFFYLYYPCHLLILWAIHEFLYLPMVR